MPERGRVTGGAREKPAPAGSGLTLAAAFEQQVARTGDKRAAVPDVPREAPLRRAAAVPPHRAAAAPNLRALRHASRRRVREPRAALPERNTAHGEERLSGHAGGGIQAATSSRVGARLRICRLKVGRSRAPHLYLYASRPRRKSAVCLPSRIASRSTHSRIRPPGL